MIIIVRMNRRKNPKSEQIKKQPKRPKTPLVLEPNFSKYLTEKPYDKSQLHINKQRTLKRTLSNFETYKYLAESKLLDLEYKNQLFSSSMIDSFSQSFQFYDRENTEGEEQNKLNIAIDGITRGIHYFQNRYPESSLAYKQAEQIQEFLQMLSQVTARKAEDEKAIEFYKIRHTMLLPPKFLKSETRYMALCRICWGYYEDEDVKKVISKIRHYKRCPYDRNDLERCIEVFPPKNPIKKN